MSGRLFTQWKSLEKRELLVHMINDGNWDQVLVFARTRHGAEKLSKQLTKDGIQSVAIHGDKTQGHRTRSLERFKKGTVRVLVATDVASRGLDIKQLPRVVNYELPDVAEDYVHRIGRTGRAKEKGDAHSFVCKSESKKLSAVEDLLGKKINKVEIEGFEGELIQYRADKKKPRARKAPRRSNGRERRDSRFDKKPSSRKKIDHQNLENQMKNLEMKNIGLRKELLSEEEKHLQEISKRKISNLGKNHFLKKRGLSKDGKLLMLKRLLKRKILSLLKRLAPMKPLQSAAKESQSGALRKKRLLRLKNQKKLRKIVLGAAKEENEGFILRYENKSLI